MYDDYDMQPIGGDHISNTNANLSWTFPQQKEVAAIVFFFIKSGNVGDVKRNRSWLFCEFHSLMSESTFGQVVAVAKKTKSVE